MWIDVSCLPNNVRPAGKEEAVSAAAKGLAVAEAVAAADAAEVQTEGQVPAAKECLLLSFIE